MPACDQNDMPVSGELPDGPGRARRGSGRFQLTTNRLEGYVPAVEEHFGADADFARLIKNYAAPRTDGPDWYRPSHHVVSTVPTSVVCI